MTANARYLSRGSERESSWMRSCYTCLSCTGKTRFYTEDTETEWWVHVCDACVRMIRADAQLRDAFEARMDIDITRERLKPGRAKSTISAFSSAE